MARTFGGFVFYNPAMLNFIQSAGTVALTRNAQADVSINLSASSTAQILVGLDKIKRPYFTFPAPVGVGTVPTSNEFQEVFGGSGVPGNPWNGGQTGTQFGTSAIPWGLALLDVVVYYSVVTNPLSVATVTIARNSYAEGVANAQTLVANATAIATTTTTNATTLHASKVTLAQPISFEGTDNSDLLLEVILTTPAGGTSRVYGIGAHVAVEYS
jgi:hypothetical protein